VCTPYQPANMHSFRKCIVGSMVENFPNYGFVTAHLGRPETEFVGS
jgi:hypothetical protein